ncbi:hypothetical protein AMTRI_Chr01g112300 [Amborella trichopoda]
MPILEFGKYKPARSLVPPPLLKYLLKATKLRASYTKVEKVTNKIHADYPLLELALETCFPLKNSNDRSVREGELFRLVLKIIHQRNGILSDEWINIFFWCLGNSESCYLLWESLFMECIMKVRPM